MSLVQLAPNIYCLPASEKPLSCDIVFIKTKEATWIFDVGLSSEAAEEINKIPGKKNIVISHFHPDHILNLCKIKYDQLFVSKNTKKYTFKGTVVEEDLCFEVTPESAVDGECEKQTLKIMQLPSSHAKGCLVLVYGNYAFMGDGTYSRPVRGHHTYNAQLLQQMIEVMESIPVEYFCLSHDSIFVQHKTSVVRLYKDIYSRRQNGNPTIDVEDFFNPDGSVKAKDK